MVGEQVGALLLLVACCLLLFLRKSKVEFCVSRCRQFVVEAVGRGRLCNNFHHQVVNW